MTIALGGLINTHAKAILLKLLAKYYILKVQKDALLFVHPSSFLHMMGMSSMISCSRKENGLKKGTGCQLNQQREF
jgi:hypothetical protein